MKFKTSENRDGWEQTDQYQIFVERTIFDGYCVKTHTIIPKLIINPDNNEKNI